MKTAELSMKRWRSMLEIKVKAENLDLWPTRAHYSDAGADLKSNETWIIMPGEKRLVDTGIAVKIPEGFVGMVFNRSSQGKIGVKIANGTGIIDADYRGNIKVLLENTGSEPYTIMAKDTRIAQLVILPIVLPRFMEHLKSEVWEDTKRGTGGFGSTGT